MNTEKRFGLPDKPLNPLFPWVGGKRRLLSLIEQYEPAVFRDYHEPFLGGGAVALRMMEKHPDKVFHLSDLNPHIINTYEQVKLNPNDVVAHLEGHEDRHSPEYFMSVRGWDRRGLLDYKTPAERAARFMYLVQCSYRTKYEEDDNGFCISTVGYDQKINKENLYGVSELLNKRDVRFYCQSFTKSHEVMASADYVYLDPPYSTTLNDETRNNNIKYHKAGNAEDIQVELKRFISIITSKAVYVAASNSDTRTTQELYEGWTQVSTELIHNMSKKVAVEKLFLNHFLASAVLPTQR